MSGIGHFPQRFLASFGTEYVIHHLERHEFIVFAMNEEHRPRAFSDLFNGVAVAEPPSVPDSVNQGGGIECRKYWQVMIFDYLVGEEVPCRAVTAIFDEPSDFQSVVNGVAR